MSYHAPSESTSFLQSIDQGAICVSQWQRYGSSPFGTYKHVSKPTNPMATVHILRRSILLTMIHFSTYFFGWPPLTDASMIITVSGWGWDRERRWYKLAHVCQRWRNLVLVRGSGPSVFATSVQLARPLQTCWHIHPLSSLIT